MPPRRDPKMVQRMAWMRARVARLLPGTAGEKTVVLTVISECSRSKTVAGVMRRLNGDRPDQAGVGVEEPLPLFFSKN